MRFYPQCYYRHTSGRMLHVLCIATTFIWGTTLLAEDDSGCIVPIGHDSDDYATNWTRITEEVWLEEMLPDSEREDFYREADNDALLQ